MNDRPPVIELVTPGELNAKAARSIRENRGFYRVIGFVAIIMGLAAIALPGLASVAVELMLGAILAIGGLAQIINAFMARRGTAKVTSSLLLGLMGLIAGGLLLAYPWLGLITLTLVMSGYFLASGFTRLYFATTLRPTDRWGWLLASGVASLALALLILTGLPLTATWAVGILFAVDSFFYGMALLGIVSGSRAYLGSDI
ncbi:HdeD family acid-resistance protein [Pseudokordiimonas caeni]|uniref:HdeD family acid-resistance protein n=1 Tax=Pseudokordiimonas caeni TaxID=2997908 RepID=UPI002810F025|nr:DUF308 domain-containing protein [Pseudokordiimonas caeni]